jgi:uncharacterized protein
MKVVIDTSVFVSAVLAIEVGNRPLSRFLVECGFRGEKFELVTSEPLIRELGDVLSRAKLQLSAGHSTAFVERVASAATIVAIRGLVMGCRDPRDDKVLETALNANVDFIIARDRDLYEPRARYSIEKVGIGIRDRPIRVVGVRAFVEAMNGPDFSALVAATLVETP